jgi:hypothetical protein
VIWIYECIRVFVGGSPIFKELLCISSLLSILDMCSTLTFGVHDVYFGFL